MPKGKILTGHPKNSDIWKIERRDEKRSDKREIELKRKNLKKKNGCKKFYNYNRQCFKIMQK